MVRPSLKISTAADCSSLLAFYSSAGRSEADHMLVRVATAMRAHGRGGSLLVVPSNSVEWLTSMVQPITYSLVSAFPEISECLHQQEESDEASNLRLQAA